jgi:hypothetical protein
MKLNESMEPFREAIEALHHLFSKINDRGVVTGGVAVGFLGKPRLTEDVDAVILLSEKELPEFLEIASAEKIFPRIKKAEEFARENRVLLLQHSPSETNMDISLGFLPFEEEMVARGVLLTFTTLSIRLPTPEDLIIMKAVAHRPKDLEDIRTIVEKQSNLDKERIEDWVKSFAEDLEMQDLWKQIEELLRK